MEKGTYSDPRCYACEPAMDNTLEDTKVVAMMKRYGFLSPPPPQPLLTTPEDMVGYQKPPKPYHSGSLYNRTMDRIADAINSHIAPADIEELDVLARGRAE